MAEKTRYSDAELEEFRAIIMEKLELAQRDYDQLKMSLMGLDGNDILCHYISHQAADKQKAEKYVFSSSYMELVQSLPSPLWLRSTLSV